jgi:pimeloyl-ACP methyl ester carboxylesterase
MSAHSIVCLHGYGVRGYFWEVIRPHLETLYERVLTPDLRMNTIESVLQSGRDVVTEASRQDGAPVAVVGHSLGAVVAALAAKELGTERVERAILLAPPFGEKAEVPGKLVRFLLKHHLIPDFLSRPQFFSRRHTPLTIQKSMFKRAVDESAELQTFLFRPKRFHTDLFDGPLAMPVLVVASEGDRIVPARESVEFAERIEAALSVYGARRGIGHDDLTCSPQIAAELAERIRSFAETDR